MIRRLGIWICIQSSLSDRGQKAVFKWGMLQVAGPILCVPVHPPRWLMEAVVLVICSPPGLALPIQMTLPIVNCRSPNKKNTVVHCGKCAPAQEPKRKEKGGLQRLNYCSHETIGLRRWLENEAEKRHYDFCYNHFFLLFCFSTSWS